MSDVTGNDSLTVLNDVVDLDVFDKSTTGYQITGTWVGTITWTGSIDGATFFAILPINSTAATTTVNANLWFNTLGLTRIRMTMTAYTSGTAVVNWVAAGEPAPNGTPVASGSVPGVGATNLGKAEDAPHTSGDTGVLSLNVRNDTNANLTSADADYGALKVDQTGSGFFVSTLPALQAALGVTQHRVLSAASTNATSVKGASGSVSSIVVTNTNAAIRFVKFFSKATAPTVGTDTPTLVIGVPPTATVFVPFPVALPFTTGIGYCMTVGFLDADVAAVAAGDLLMTIIYK